MRMLATLAVSVALCRRVVPGKCATSENTGQSDSDVEQSLKSKLTSDPKMADTKVDVSADTDKNQVTLSGARFTPSRRARKPSTALRKPDPASKLSTKSM